MTTLKNGSFLDGAGGGAADTSQQQVIYVAKAGSDSNSGLNINEPKLTIGAAITYINTQTPADATPWSINVIDGAKYSESFTVPVFTTLNALQATIDGTVTLTDGTSHAYLIDDSDDNVKVDGDTIGNVDGAASSTDNAIARYDGVTGKLIQDSSATIDDTGLIEGATIAGDDVSIDSAGFLSLSGTDSQSLWEQADAAINKARGTEVLGGTGAVTFTIGTTVFDVAPTTGQIKDSTGYYPISYAGATGVAITGGATSSIYVYLDKAGALQQQLTEPTCEEYREKLFLTRLFLLSGSGTLSAQEEIANPAGQYVNQLRDFVSYFPSQHKGLILSANANLTFQTSAGSIFELGVNNSANPDCPNEVPFLPQNPTEFFYLKQDALISESQTSLNVTQYDNGGTLTAMTNNRFKIMTVYKFGSGNHVVQEGQAQYTSLDEAQVAISTRTYTENPAVANGTRLGWIIVQKDMTDLTDTNVARFVNDSGSFNTSIGTAGALIAANNLADVDDVTTSRNSLNAQEDISGATLTSATVSGTDKVLIQDTDDSDNLKTVTAQSIADLNDGFDESALTDDEGIPYWDAGNSRLTTVANFKYDVSEGYFEVGTDANPFRVNLTDGFVEIPERIGHTADSNTYMNMTSDNITCLVGGWQMLILSEGGTDNASLGAANSTSTTTIRGGGNYTGRFIDNGMAINSSAKDASASLDVVDSTRGTLLNRWTTTERDAIVSPATGLEGYNETTLKKNVYNGTAWVEVFDEEIAVADLADGTDGELITWDAAGAPTTVGAGTSGQILTSNGAGAAPTFQDAAGGGGGKVLQVVSVTDNGPVNSTSTTLINTGLTATITPSSTSSKILVLTHVQGMSSTAASTRGEVALDRDSTIIHRMCESCVTVTSGSNIGETVSSSYVDSPASVSPVTYSAKFARSAGSGTITVHNYGTGSGLTKVNSSMVLMEIGV